MGQSAASVDYLERLASDARALDGWPGLLVGDMSQPRGGPMLGGHTSHQVGLDADIWLTPMPDRILTDDERENMVAVTMLKDPFTVDPNVFTIQQVKLIKRAASYPQVARIFVHPAIKKALCEQADSLGKDALGLPRCGRGGTTTTISTFVLPARQAWQDARTKSR
ncbi:MAG: penicillin-insensitive murein endopeptidase [Hyphomicrobiales bacterium]